MIKNNKRYVRLADDSGGASSGPPTVKQSNPLLTSRSRKFVLQRNDDETGISGTGIVAEGIEFSSGWCALSWLTAGQSVGLYPNIKQLEAIHGHNGRAIIVWEN